MALTPAEEDKLRSILTRSVDMNQRRIKNAAPSIDQYDYVIRKEIEALIAPPLPPLSTSRIITVKDFPYNAKGDGKIIYDASMVVDDNTVFSNTANFIASDVGKLIVIPGVGPGYTTLSSPIISRISNTRVAVAVGAGVTASSRFAVYGSDDTLRIQQALDDNYRLYFPTSIYCCTHLRLKQGHQLIGFGIDTTALARMNESGGDAFVQMITDEVAQKVQVLDMSFYCNQIGSNNDGVALGTQSNLFAFANGSYLNNIRVLSASGIGLYINSNASLVGQIWVQNADSLGTPDNLNASNTMGFKVTDTTFYADLISVEGRYQNGDVELSCGGLHISNLQLETGGDTVGTFASKDCVAMNNTQQTIDSIFIHSDATRRDVFRIANGAQCIKLSNIFSELPITATNLINDLNTHKAFPMISQYTFFPYYYTDLFNNAVWDDEIAISNTRGTTFLAPNSGGYYARNQGDTANFPLVRPDVNDRVFIGSTSDNGIIFRSGSFITSYVHNTATIAVGIIPGGTNKDVAISLSGVTFNDDIILGFPAAIATIELVTFCAWVSGSGTVTIRIFNHNAAPTSDLGDQIFSVAAWLH